MAFPRSYAPARVSALPVTRIKPAKPVSLKLPKTTKFALPKPGLTGTGGIQLSRLGKSSFPVKAGR
jgi:hypothetical protein